MSGAKRIGLELLSDDLRGLISSSTKIFPVLDSYVSTGQNPGGYEFVRITDGARKNHVFVWDDGFKLIGADDSSVDWSQVENKPLAYNPMSHHHNDLYAPIVHSHDSVYAPLAHLHDDAYAPISHNHTGVYSPLVHDHDSVYSKLAHSHEGVYAPFVHSHDSAYALKSTEALVSDHESRLSSIEGGYSEGHFHSNLDVLERISYTGIRGVIDLKDIENVQAGLTAKVDSSTFTGHVGNSTVHVTQTEKDVWSAKADAVHSHSYSSLSGVPSSFTPSAHSHSVSDVSGLQSALDGKSSNSHTHSYNDLTDKPVVADEITIGNVQPTSNLWYKVVS